MSDWASADRCPFCRGMMTDLWDFEWGLREELETECEHCGRDVLVRRRVDVEYSVHEPMQHKREGEST